MVVVEYRKIKVSATDLGSCWWEESYFVSIALGFGTTLVFID